MRASQTITEIADIDFLCGVENGVIDLSAVNAIGPVGVVAILATLERLSKQSSIEGLTLSLPMNQNIQSYLRSAGVFDAIREYYDFQGTQPEELIPEPLLVRQMVPCTHFRCDSDIDRLADEMEDRFRTEFPGYASLLPACHEIFSELATNVVYHAESEGGYVLASSITIQLAR